jgi:CDP-diacylglycerol--serine O-phosphatidyltransferase
MFTLFNLFLGYLALMQIIKGNFLVAIYLITGSVIMDGFDGTVARLTKTESNFGVQLDSLVDGVTFGLVSAALIYLWGFKAEYSQIGKVISFLFLSAGIIRLARFNVLKEVNAVPANIFIGLPIPTAALSICSVVLLFKDPLINKLNIIGFAIYVILIALLMISNIKYRTLKKIRPKSSLPILFFLAIIIAFLINFPSHTIPLVTFLYLISPLFFYIARKIKKVKEPVTVDIQSIPDRRGKTDT